MQDRIPIDWQGPRVSPSIADLKRFRDSPHRFLLHLVRQHGDVVWYGTRRVGFVLGAHPKHVHHVLVDGQRTYSKDTFQYRLLGDVTGDGLLTSDGDLWRERRRIQQPAFHRARLDLVSKTTIRSVDELWRRWMGQDSRQVNVADEMFRLSLDIVMGVLFGAPLGDRAPRIVEATAGVLDHLIHRSRSLPGLPSWTSPLKQKRFKKSLNTLDGAIAEILSTRRAAVRDGHETPGDLLNLLVNAEREQRITPSGVRNEMITMIIAGHETVASALTWSWLLLAQRPDVEDALGAEARAINDVDGLAAVESLQTARNVISEALRLYPPAWIVSRRSTPGDMPGDWLPKGTLVLLSPYVTQRHPDLWSDPDTFDPTRFEQSQVSGSYFPFGAGPRLCIGRDFSLVEAVIILSELSRRCRLRPTATDVRDYAGVTLQPAGGLVAQIIPRNE